VEADDTDDVDRAGERPGDAVKLEFGLNCDGATPLPVFKAIPIAREGRRPLGSVRGALKIRASPCAS
jgi:hypothetical protein